MLQAGLALLALVAFFDAGCEAFSKPTLYALRPPAVGLLRSASPRIAGHSSVSMNEKIDNFVGRRAALLSLAFVGAGTLFNPKTANSEGAPSSLKLLEQVHIPPDLIR
jgi:hypothetical protein